MNLGCFELLLRRAQLIEYTYSTNGPAPPLPASQAESSAESKPQPKKGKGGGRGERRVGMYDESAIFLGAHKEFGDVMVSPDLLDYVSHEVEREAAVMKQVRKAREERDLARQAP